MSVIRYFFLINFTNLHNQTNLIFSKKLELSDHFIEKKIKLSLIILEFEATKKKLLLPRKQIHSRTRFHCPRSPAADAAPECSGL